MAAHDDVLDLKPRLWGVNASFPLPIVPTRTNEANTLWAGRRGGLNLEVLDGILEHTLERVIVVDNEVGHVPVHEEFARLAADNFVGRHTGIRAA